MLSMSCGLFQPIEGAGLLPRLNREDETGVTLIKSCRVADHQRPKKQAHGLLADFVAAMTTHLKQGDRIRMSGLGILEVKNRTARTGRNPATGETIQIKASKKVAFRQQLDAPGAFAATGGPDRRSPGRAGGSPAGGDSTVLGPHDETASGHGFRSDCIGGVGLGVSLRGQSSLRLKIR
jgi:nucleoid DNA-binding protein